MLEKEKNSLQMLNFKEIKYRGAVVAERSRAQLHGTGGPRFKSRRFLSIFETLEEMESGEEMESRERKWKAERGDGKPRY